jgi:hypothetical protein
MEIVPSAVVPWQHLVVLLWGTVTQQGNPAYEDFFGVTREFIGAVSVW